MLFMYTGDFEGQEDLPIEVTFEQYRKLETGDKIKVNVGEGLFHRGYYYYERNPVPSSKLIFQLLMMAAMSSCIF